MDEFISPLPTLSWTEDWLDDWLDRLSDGVASLKLPYTWLDKPTYGSADTEAILAIEPDLSGQEVLGIEKLRQNSKMVRVWHHIDYHKSLHRTKSVARVTTHLSDQGEETVQKSSELVVYHADRVQLTRDEVEQFAISRHVLRHWLALSSIIRSVRWQEL